MSRDKFFVGARTHLDDVVDDLAHSTPAGARPGKVSSLEGTRQGTTSFNPQLNPDRGQPMPEDIDALFGAKQPSLLVRNEKPEHRLMLWYKIQGFSNREVANLLRYSETHVSQVVRQPWFQDAFCKLAKEMGEDACETFLKGEVLPALERTADIARNGESEAVRLAANKEILDRFLGKSTVKIEAKQTIDVTNTTIDAAKLLEEQRRLDEQIRANGLNLHGPS